MKEAKACALDINKLISHEELDDDDRQMIEQVVNELPTPAEAPNTDNTSESIAEPNSQEKPTDEAEITQQAPEENDNIDYETYDDNNEKEINADPLVDPFNLTLESDEDIPASTDYLTHDPILS